MSSFLHHIFMLLNIFLLSCKLIKYTFCVFNFYKYRLKRCLFAGLAGLISTPPNNYNSKIKHLVAVFPFNTPFSIQAIYYVFVVSNSNIVEIPNNNNAINDISLSKICHLSEPPIYSSYSFCFIQKLNISYIVRRTSIFCIFLFLIIHNSMLSVIFNII